MARRDEEATRIADLRSYVWPVVKERFGGFQGLRILDVATNAGGFAIEAAKSGAKSVLGIDIVDHYLAQANFIRSALELDNVRFAKISVENLLANDIGTFDISFCFDVLYHFENPVLALRRIAEVTRQGVVIETRLADVELLPEVSGPNGIEVVAGPAWFMNTLPISEEQNVDRSTSRWRTTEICQFLPTANAVEALLRFVGFDLVERVPLRAEDAAERFEQNARRGIFVARRSGATKSR